MANTPATSGAQSLGLDRFLSPTHAKELAALEKRFKEPRGLLQELNRRGWLTNYQAQLLAQGKGSELIIGPYRILDRLGEGAVGQVFKAVHEKQNLLVALKVLKKDVQTGADTVGRFRREIEAVSQVAHPNIVKAYEAGTAAGHLYLAMEYVEGIDLDRLIKQAGPLPPAKACEYIRQAALALQHVHERGLVHRDIKPANFFLAGGRKGSGVADGQIKLLDLGLARLLQPKADSTTSNLTMLAGNAVTYGTPDYLAPEQAIDLRSADIRADIYSLGCTFFYLLTGQPPFPGGSLTEKLMRHHQAEPPALTELRPELPGSLDGIVKRMLAKRPADRYQTPGEVARDLEKVFSDGRALTTDRPKRKIPRAVLVGLPLLLLGLVGWLLISSGQRESAPTTSLGTAPQTQSPVAATRTVVLQGREFVMDTLLDFSKPDIPFGSTPRDIQLIKHGDSTSAFLVRFALDKLPAITKVEQAIFTFYVWDPHQSGTTKAGLFAVKAPWREAPATWNRPVGGSNWLGGDHFDRGKDAGPLLGFAVVRPDQGGDTAEPPIEYQIDATATVRDWLSGAAPNYGFALIPIPDRQIDGGHSTRFQIYASEHNRPQFTPKLTVRVQ